MEDACRRPAFRALGPVVRRRADAARRDADRRRRADAQVPRSLDRRRRRAGRLCAGDRHARGVSPRRCSIARISASTRSTCCFRRSCGSRSTSPASFSFVGFFALVAWHGCGVVVAILDVGLAQPVRAGDADGDPAGALDRRALLPSWWSACCCCVHGAQARCAGDLRGMAQLISTRSAEEEVEEEIRDAAGRAASARDEADCSASRSLILIGLLALAIPVAAGLGFLGLSLSALYSKLPLSLAMGEITWAHVEQFPAGGDSVLRPARRDPAALRHGRAHVQRAGAVDVVAARRPDAFQYRRLRDVRARRPARASRPRRRSAPWRMGEIEKRGYNGARCSSAPSRPAARSAS